MKLPRRQFLHLAAGVAALPAVSGRVWAPRPDTTIGVKCGWSYCRTFCDEVE